MACVGSRNVNPFSLLDSLNPPPPNEVCEALPQRNSARKGTPRDPIHVPAKLPQNGNQSDPKQCNPSHRQSTNTHFVSLNANRDGLCDSPKLPLTNDPRQTLPQRNVLDKGILRDHTPIRQRNPAHRPNGNAKLVSQAPGQAGDNQQRHLLGNTKPRFTADLHQRNCSRALPPRLQNKSIDSKVLPNGFCNPTSRSCSEVIDPCLTPTLMCAEKESLNAQLNQLVLTLQRQPSAMAQAPFHSDTYMPMSQRNAEQRPRVPELVSYSSTDASTLIDPSTQLKVSLPHPPGLSRPSERGRKFSNRARGSIKPVNGERRCNQVAEESNFERHNGPVDTSRVISPPPSEPTSNAVKLPARKNTQQAPRSPMTSASSLSEDLSGSSSVLLSDTTVTSVDSVASSQYPKISAAICRRWTNGLPCYILPCRFLHPPRPAPPSRTVESLQRPELLYSTTISDHIKVQFDQGFQVRDVLTGFESRWVHIGNISGTATSAALNKLLAPYNVENINMPELSGRPVTAKIQFASTADAIKAVTDLNGIEFSKKTISAKLAINNSIRGSTVLTDTDVQITWQCPFRVGYVGYDTLKEAKAAIDSLNGFLKEYLVVSAQLYEGLPCVGAYNVILKQLPASMTELGLREFAKSKAVMVGRPNYQSLDKAVDCIRSRLEEYGTITSFDVIPPPYKDGIVKAWARFTSPAEARAAQEDLDRRRPKPIGHTTLSCRHVVSVSHVMSAASYKKMREDIGWLRWSWQRRFGPSVSIRERCKENADEDVPVYIRLSSEQPELLSSLKYEYEQLLHGETVTLDRKPLWDNFLIAEAGHTYIAQLQAKYPGIQIQVQNKRRVISLWGPIVMRHRARQEIVRKIVELKAQQFWKIPLSGKLLGLFRSAELSTLQELLGSENCILDFGERVLVIRGNDLAFRTACDAVQAAQSRESDGAHSSDTFCPVCFGEPIVPVSLACGHQWCRSCLGGYLTSAVENKTFPLKCLGNDATCAECIPLGLSRKLLSAADFNAVIEAAFWVYVHSRPDEFHPCPTPDCTQVYRSAPPNSVLQCPSCLVRICPTCRIESHDGLTCEERDVAEDKLFKEWTSSHDVKSCPGCKAPIERSEGCNHMTCTRCQTHSCWECLATFPRGQGIYDHMRIQHGGIGL